MIFVGRSLSTCLFENFELCEDVLKRGRSSCYLYQSTLYSDRPHVVLLMHLIWYFPPLPNEIRAALRSNLMFLKDCPSLMNCWGYLYLQRHYILKDITFVHWRYFLRKYDSRILCDSCEFGLGKPVLSFVNSNGFASDWLDEDYSLWG